MERLRIRKSISTSCSEGMRQSLKHKSPSRLPSASSYTFTGGSKWGNEVIIFGVEKMPTMKKLLAEEMSRQSEPSKRAPSAIVKLMGVEALPSPKHVHRQHRNSDICQQTDAALLNSQFLDHGYRRSSMGHQEFKDVYEDFEASHTVKRRCSSRRNARSIVTTLGMTPIQRKLLDAEQLVCDEMLQDLEAMDDTLEMHESHECAMLNFHKQPDSLVVKCGPQFVSKSYRGSPITVLAPLDSEKYENKAKTWRSEKQNYDKLYSISSLTRKDGILLEVNPRRSHLFRSCRRSLLEEDDEENVLLKTMDMLKPKQGKIRFAGSSCSLTQLPHEYGCKHHLQREYRRTRDAQKVTQTRKFQSHKIRLPRPMSREAMEISRRIAMRMREGWDEYVDANSTSFDGYIGDASSNESDSGTELDLFQSRSRKSLSETELCGFPLSSRGESPVNTEARKQLSKRWKPIQNYPNMEMTHDGSTLAEMLSLSDRESTSGYPTSRICFGRLNNQSHCYKAAAKNNTPLGISSRDGWKDDMSTRQCRSRSLSASHGIHEDSLEENQHKCSCGVYRGRNKLNKGNLNQKEGYRLPNVSSSCDGRPHFFQTVTNQDAYCLAASSFKVQPDVAFPDASGEPSSLQVAADEVVYESPLDEVTLAPILEGMIIPSTSFGISTMHSSDGPEFTDCCKNWIAKEAPVIRSAGEPESSESFKEADHPSPVSVLEAPCRCDTSSGESIEKASGALHELRNQLQLLNTDATLLLADKDTTSSVSGNIAGHAPERWQNSYALDLLIRSPLEDSDFRAIWHSPSDAKLFEDLEKKYSGAMMGSKPERRLLFDRLNASLLEILEDHVDSSPWVMPKLRGWFPEWEKEAVAAAIDRLMMNEDAPQWDEPERELDREMQWSDVRGEINLVGVEMESLLMDELMSECCCLVPTYQGNFRAEVAGFRWAGENSCSPGLQK